MINDEYLTANSLIAYPFKETSVALAPADMASADAWAAGLFPRDAFLDFFMFINEEVEPVSLSLTYIARSGSVMTLKFTDYSGDVVLQSTVDFSTLQAYAPLTLLQDLIEPAILLHTGYLTVGEGLLTFPNLLSITYSVDELSLVESTYPIKPLSLLQVDADAAVDIMDADGVITLLEGYNVDLSTREIGSLDLLDTPENEDTTSIVIQAAPGLGQGVAPPEVQVAPTYLVSLNNNVYADSDGAVALSQQGECHRFIANPAGNEITVYNDCDPCCDCPDYAGPVVTMKNYWEELDAIRVTLISTVALYNQHVELWNDSLLPGIRKIYLAGVGIKSFFGDANKHTLTITLINQGNTVPQGKLRVTLPGNTVSVPKVVLKYDKTSSKKCSDLEEDTEPAATTPNVIGTQEVTVDFAPLCYCTTAQLLIVVQTAVATPPAGDVTVKFEDVDETLAEATIKWK